MCNLQQFIENILEPWTDGLHELVFAESSFLASLFIYNQWNVDIFKWQLIPLRVQIFCPIASAYRNGHYVSIQKYMKDLKTPTNTGSS